MLYLVAQTAVVAAVFLGVAGFFAAWDGRAVGVLTPISPEPAVYEVVVVQADDSTVVRTMPRALVLGMDLPVLPGGVPPDPVPETAPATRKARFSLSYLVQSRAEGAAERTWTAYPTTTPQALGLAVVIWLLALAIRNMAYAGAPWAIERTDVYLPKALVRAGELAETNRADNATERPRKAPPPPKSRRGPRR